MNIPNAFTNRKGSLGTNSQGSLGRDVQNVIGKKMRPMYEDLFNQAMPDGFTELLQKLDKGGHEDSLAILPHSKTL